MSTVEDAEKLLSKMTPGEKAQLLQRIAQESRDAYPGIDTIDVVATQRHFLVIGAPLTGCRLIAADVNGDNAVNTVDVVAIQRFFLILPTGIANVGKYQFIPANRNYLGIVTDQTGQNYDTLIFGDVASPFAAP